MSHVTSASTPRFESIFNSALDAYKRRTSQDLASHPLLPKLQSCNSPDAILAILGERIPGLGQPQNNDGTFSKWLVPTVNVLYAFSATLGEGVGLVSITLLPLRTSALISISQVFSPARVIFAGIGVLFLVCTLPCSPPHTVLTRVLQAAKDVSASQDKLVDLFNRIGHFFRRLEIYTEVPPTSAMTDIIVEIMVEVLAILGIATKEMKRGRASESISQ